MNLLSILGQPRISKMESNNNCFKLRNNIWADSINKPFSTFWERTVGLKKGIESKLTNFSKYSSREKPSFLRLDSTGNTIKIDMDNNMDNKMKRKFISQEGVQKNGFYNSWGNMPQFRMNNMLNKARMNYNACHTPVDTVHVPFQNMKPNDGTFVPPYLNQFHNPKNYCGYSYPGYSPGTCRAYMPEFFVSTAQDKMKKMSKSTDKLEVRSPSNRHEGPSKAGSINVDEDKQLDNICVNLALVDIASEYSSSEKYLDEQKTGADPVKCTQLSTEDTNASAIQPDNKMHICQEEDKDTVGFSFLIKSFESSSENFDTKAAENFCDKQCSFDVFVSNIPNAMQGSPTKIKVQCKEKHFNETSKKKKKKSRPSQKKRHRLKQQKGLIENPHVSSFIENVKRVKTSHQKCNNNKEAKMTSTSNSVTFAVDIDISQASVCDKVEKYDAQVFLRSSSSDESDLESVECDAVNGALWESFASPMTLNLTCMATAVSLQSEDEESVSSTVREANIRWLQGLQKQVSHCDKKDYVRKVLFDDDHVMVHEVECWERKGPWEEIGRDRERFKNRIQNIEDAIGYIFKPEHRNKVLSKRTSSVC